MQEEGRGMVFWHPKGWTLWRTLEAYMRRRLDAAGYVEVKTPQVLDRTFWEKSGHWEKYRPNMFVCETVEGEELSLKPMNCPGHVQIFKSASGPIASCRCAWPSSAPATATSRRARCTA